MDKLPASVEGAEYSFVNRQALENDSFPSQEVADNTRKNADMTTAQSSNGKLSFNPFSKTLATMEPNRDSGNKLDANTRKATNNTSFKTMDVDSFKRLLMTGSSGFETSLEPPTAVGAAVTGAIFGQAENSKDSSAMAGQSRTPTLPGSSRSSLADAESASEDDENKAQVDLSNKAKPPPPPTPRNGKMVYQRTPQVVSFSDFSKADFSTDTVTSAQPVASRPSFPNNSSELNKALPSRPSEPRRESLYGSVPSISQSDATQTSARVSRLPPPPPAVRGHNRNRSTSNTSIQSSDISEVGRGSSPGPAQAGALKIPSTRPPPPPTRRGGTRGIPSPEAVLTPDVNENSSQAEDGFSFNPTYPSRPLISTVNSTRSGSFSGRGGIPAPPPPPPRRRGSSKGSVDVPRPGTSSPGESRRTSVEYYRSSMDSVRRVSGTSDAEAIRRGSGDVLADLSALQAEVEALRQQRHR